MVDEEDEDQILLGWKPSIHFWADRSSDTVSGRDKLEQVYLLPLLLTHGGR